MIIPSLPSYMIGQHQESPDIESTTPEQRWGSGLTCYKQVQISIQGRHIGAMSHLIGNVVVLFRCDCPITQ